MPLAPALADRARQALDHLPDPVQGALEVGVEMMRESKEDRINGLAAEMAFFGLLGVFPALLILTALLGWLDTLLSQTLAADVERTVTTTLAELLTEDAETALAAVESLFEDQRGGVLTAAFVGAVYATSRTFAAVIVALDVAYDLEERRPWVRKRLTGLGLGLGTVLVSVVVLAMVVIGPLLGGGQAVADLVRLGDTFAFLWTWLRWPFALLVLVGWATTIFDLGPAIRTQWRWQLPGAALFAVAALGVSLGFSAYLRLAGDSNLVYGVLGGGLIMLFWLYLLSLALLVGAELNAILIVRRRGSVEAVRTDRGEPDPPR